MVFHVLNRGNDRREIFDDRADYEAFLRVIEETQQRVPMRVLAYCLLSNHWHFLLWPAHDGDLTRPNDRPGRWFGRGIGRRG